MDFVIDSVDILNVFLEFLRRQPNFDFFGFFVIASGNDISGML